MKPFTKSEAKGVGIILFVILLLTLSNLSVSLRKSRDAQRRADLGAVSNALHKFFDDFGFFPPAENGNIKACKGDNFDEVVQKAKSKETFDRRDIFEGLGVCAWGEDGLSDLGLFGTEEEEFMKTIPKDPKQKEGMSYFYISNTKRFQIYSAFEGGKSEEGYDTGIVGRGLSCGSKICSFGKSYTDTPLDRSIEEFEQELLERLGSSGN